MPVVGIWKKGIIMRVMYKLLIIAACCIPVQAFAIEKVSVSELLDKYATNQDRLASFIAKTEETITSNWSNKPGPEFQRWVTELRLDGKKAHLLLYIWDDLPAKGSPTPIEDAEHYVQLWNGKFYIEYYVAPTRTPMRSPREVHISTDERHRKSTFFVYYGAPFLGIRYSDYERIDLVLRQADAISVRDKLEQVGSVGCYVIDAKTKSGTYTVWIDPEHGYNIAKADVRVGPNDVYRRGRLSDNKSESLSIRNIRFQKINDAWVSMEADSYSTSSRQDGLSVQSTVHHKITQITLNPDHDVLRSFALEFEAGTAIRNIDSGVIYIWQDGMKLVVDEWDGGIRYVPKEWSLLVGVGKPLPQLEGIKLNLSSEQTKNRAILLCFFDMNQRPSRHCIRQLAQRAAGLKEKGVTVAAVETSQVAENTLNEWTKKRNIPFPVGAITADIEKTRFAWGVRSLPWLILSDNQHIVTAEGFGPKELNDKIKATEPKPKAPANKCPSALDLLDRYAANQDKLKSFVVKSRTKQTNVVTKDGTAPYSKVKREIVEFRYEDDGGNFRAYYCPKDVHSATDGSLVPADRHNSYLWDRERYIEHHKGSTLDKSSTYISFSVKNIKDAITIGYFGAGSILGFLYGDVERFDSILRQADSISVQDEPERVGSVDCYVIDAKTKHGIYTVWLDPKHGYGIAKAVVNKGPEDLRFGRPRSSYIVSTDTSSFFVENVRFENIEGIWIPMEADFRIDSKWPNSAEWPISAETIDIHSKAIKLLLKPNHDALGSFVPDIENGTEVYTDVPGLFFAWHNGKKFVIDKWDGSIKYVPKEWSMLVGVGTPLPKFEGIKLKLSDEQTKDRAILLCFFDMNQRPSRYCVKQLTQKAATLKEKGITVAAVQTSQVTEKTLNEWKRKYNIPFSVGAITEDIEKTRFTWGVRSLPWLILTDKQHVVTAEGFTSAELNEKLGNNSKH